MASNTPSTQTVRVWWMEGVGAAFTDEEASAIFDRWLNDERAKAWDAGRDSMEEYRDGLEWASRNDYPENPYRKEHSE